MSNTLQDPFVIWKEWYDQAETQWSKPLGDTVKTEAFSAWLGFLQKQTLEYQDAIKKTAELSLAQTHLPSKLDLANLASLIIHLEQKVDELDAKVDVLTDLAKETPSRKKS